MPDFADVRVSTAGSGVLTGTAASTVSSGTATVSVGGTSITAQVARGITLAVGDPVLIARQGSAWWVSSVLYTAVPTDGGESDTAPDPKPTTTTGRLVCAPVETRSRRSGDWRTDTDDVVQGDYGSYGNSTGCAFYGSTPASLEGATVTGARLKVRRERGGTYAATGTTLWLVTQKRRPSGAPTLTSSTSGPALAVGKSTTTFSVPTSWAQAMADGTAGGLAVYDADGSPYVRLSGRGSWAGAWTLTIDWRRTS